MAEANASGPSASLHADDLNRVSLPMTEGPKSAFPYRTALLSLRVLREADAGARAVRYG